MKRITSQAALLVGASLVLSSLTSFADAFTPLSLAGAANASRMDETAADGKGGWLDLGANDLRVLPAGRKTYAGVPFDVAACADENARTCLVMGRAGEEKIALTAPAGIRGGRIYLLHAIAGGPAPEKKEKIAILKLKYADGSARECSVRAGRDVGDWTTGKGFDNAARGWTAYNNNTQVSLFVSGFDLDPKKELKEVKFKASGACPWMVVAATAGGRTGVKGIGAKWALEGSFRAPPSRTKRLARFPKGARPKNVILLIGDGMGPGTIRMASLYQHGRDGALQMQQMPVAGLCTTKSADNAVTDSAASGTAFATGTKTSNGVLGLGVASKGERQSPRMLVSVAQLAHADGRAVALMTNDRITGATPGAFYAHVLGRGEAARVAEQAAQSGYEVLVGSAASGRHFRPKEQDGDRKDGRDVVAEMVQAGYVCVTSQQDFAAAPRDRKALGFFLEEAQDEVSLEAALKTALARVGDAPKGFFMMCESALTDHGNHGNRPSYSVRGALQVDWATAAALDFAEKRGDTLVIVTADHETGAVSVVRSPESGRVTVFYGATSHTGAPVEIHAYGPGAECFEGLIDNTDIAKTLKRLLGLEEK